MNDKGIKESTIGHIERLPADAVFTTVDFSDLGDSDSIRHVLKSLTDSGSIKRAARGLYYKPRRSKLLDSFPHRH